MRSLYCAFLSMSVLLACISASTPTMAETPGKHTHDGFFLRVGAGAGYASDSAEEDGVEVTVSGGAVAPIFLDLGFALSKGFSLHASAAGWTIIGPELTISSGSESVTLDGDNDVSASVFLYGLGGTYYFDPSNSFVTVIVGASQFKLENADDPDAWESEWGFGARGMFGKEWWVSDNWGLGVAGYVDISQNKDSDDSAVSWTGVSLGALVTATFQ